MLFYNFDNIVVDIDVDIDFDMDYFHIVVVDMIIFFD